LKGGRGHLKKIFGWAGKILTVDLTKNKTSILPTMDYTDRFLGGIGIGEKLYWDESLPELTAFHPDNPLIFMTGPLAATPTPSASRVAVCGKSPCLYPETFANASFGGFVAAELKKAGYDGIMIKGTADRPVYINIENDRVEIRNANHLWGLTNSKIRQIIEEEHVGRPRILSTGPGGENKTRIGTIFSDVAGSGSMGFGSVMGSKNLKAIAIRGSGTIPVANPEKVEQLRKKFSVMIGEGYFNVFGTPMTFPGSGVEFVRKSHCHGCPQGCYRSMFKSPSGEEGIRKCVSAGFYRVLDMKLHGQLTEASFKATTLANEYSLCAVDLLFLLLWLEKCFEQGILTEKDAELPLSEMGSIDFLETMVRKLCLKEGFGAVLAEGALRASEIYGQESQAIANDFLTQTGRAGAAYSPRIFIQSSLIYATEPRPFIAELHEICKPPTKWAMWYLSKGENSYVSTEVLRKIGERFWGGEKAVDYSTYEGKALAAIKIQNRQLAKESLILCDFAWPVFDDASTEDHIGDPTLDSQFLSAVTGQEIEERKLDEIGERIFTLNRAILLREGRKGKEDDYLPEFYFVEGIEPISDAFNRRNPELFLPGNGDDIISRQGKAVDREKFEQLKDEYYHLRGWDIPTGLLKKDTLERLDLEDVIKQLDGKVI
jgi:aldehyde:ferredoxin oxidoreductase